MKKTLLSFIIAISLLISCVFGLAACSAWGAYITFETWGGSHVSSKAYNNGEPILPWTFETPTKQGYNFLGWYYDKDFNNEITSSMVAGYGSFTYYAKYEINENYFNTNTTGFWSASQETISMDVNNVSAYESILIRKTNYSTLDMISVSPLTSSHFICSNLEVFDENGKPIEDANPEPSVFVPKDKPNAAMNFVIKISTLSAGNCRLSIS